ncbi:MULTISPECIES: hypothetical protein [Sphingobium]|uniref:hypothetical protein n=1 Tax=Sphingobium TaxID=165695 RepID=UPI0013EA699F|nr:MULTISPECIES: hypothetical protein [Sphingobium]MBJ7376173.1 hypothetical protein [Sphingobium sp.]
MCGATHFIASAKRNAELQKMHLAILPIFLLSAERMLEPRLAMRPTRRHDAAQRTGFDI